MNNFKYRQRFMFNQGVNVSVNSKVNLSLNINETSNEVFLNFSGPSNVWFGMAFNAYSMSDLPYTIIFNGTGEVFEVKLGDHNPGTILNKSITVLSNKVVNNIRYVQLSRQIKGLNINYYTFDTSVSSIPLLESPKT